MNNILHDLMTSRELVELSPYLFASSMFVVAALMVFVSAFVVKRLWVAITLPITLVIVAFGVITIHSMMSQPTYRLPNHEVLFLSYMISNDQSEIYYWVREYPDSKPITVIKPYKEEEHEEADEARAATEEGVPTMIMLGNELADTELVDHKFQHDEFDDPLKNPEQQFVRPF